MYRALLLVSGLGLVACVDPALESERAYIIGGEPTTEGEFPGVGGLMYDFGGDVQLSCTGTLIAPDAVLTAAHCLDPSLNGGLIPAFTLDLDTVATAPTLVPGRAVFVHERFDIGADIAPEGLDTFFDIGILLLQEPITSVAPVRLPRPDQADALVADLDLEIVGYGVTDPMSVEFGVMYDATTKLISLNPSEIQVGMGAPQPQNCSGDSGGPALADLGDGRRVVGVVSRSFSGSTCTTGGIDTRVDAYLRWIHGKVPSGIPCGSGLTCYEEEGGCCSTGGGARGAGALFLAFVVGLTLLRRRRT